MNARILVILLVAAAALAVAFFAFQIGRPLLVRAYVKISGGRSVADVARILGPAARERLTPRFESAQVPYPPSRVTLVAFKEEQRLEVWAEHGGDWRNVADYAVCAASGTTGPKLREGDLQVPEGVYPLTVLNPNSGFHLSIRIEYPNAIDRLMAVLQDILSRDPDDLPAAD